MKKQFTLLITMLLSICALGQQKLEPLDIGDKIPNLKFENVLNHPDGEILLSDYKGKLLILDFWATWCAPCVASFPKLDSLDKAFGDDLAILPVTYQDKEEVEKLFSRMAKLKDISKPMIYGDDILRGMFPHNSLPYYVWMDQEGKVLAFTSSEEINAQKIQNALAGELSGIRNRKQQANTFDKNLPIKEQIGTNIPIQFQSSLWGYVPGFPSMASAGSLFKEEEKTIRIFFTNVHLMHLYRYAYRTGGTAINIKNIEIKTDKVGPFEDLSHKGNAQIEDWKESNNVFTYELELDRNHKDKVWEVFKADLETRFPQYKAVVELKEKPCYALVAKENHNLKTKGGQPFQSITPYEATLQNTSLNYLISSLNLKYFQHLDKMILNQTGIIGPVDLHLQCNMSNVDEINKALEAYGLEIIETTSEQEILLITDNN
ncbi:TlpA family protein disulfide reductase [Belliella marina]|uniref:TlpA family protein disulfide reductase n=1 Tax=Belliella marina TaxID=1644146 RepID=A0ABW4VNU9_9BACT